MFIFSLFCFQTGSICFTCIHQQYVNSCTSLKMNSMALSGVRWVEAFHHMRAVTHSLKESKLYLFVLLCCPCSWKLFLYLKFISAASVGTTSGLSTLFITLDILRNFELPLIHVPDLSRATKPVAGRSERQQVAMGRM